MAQRHYLRDIRKDSAYNAAKINSHRERLERQEDFAQAIRAVWIIAASAVVIALTYNYFIN